MRRIRFKNLIMPVKLAKGTSLILLGALVVLIGTFAAWQFTKIFSPTTLINNNNPVIILKTSDHDVNDNPLPNDMNDTTAPDYNDQGLVLMIPIINGQVQLPRLQGEVTYR
jgi:hypothetical protein